MDTARTFADVEMVRGPVKVTLAYRGDGCFGDFEPDNEHDERRLRFLVSHQVEGAWRTVPGASYCTNLHPELPPLVLDLALSYIMDEVGACVAAGVPILNACQKLSWIDETIFGTRRQLPAPAHAHA